MSAASQIQQQRQALAAQIHAAADLLDSVAMGDEITSAMQRLVRSTALAKKRLADQAIAVNGLLEEVAAFMGNLAWGVEDDLGHAEPDVLPLPVADRDPPPEPVEEDAEEEADAPVTVRVAACSPVDPAGNAEEGQEPPIEEPAQTECPTGPAPNRRPNRKKRGR